MLIGDDDNDNIVCENQADDLEQQLLILFTQFRMSYCNNTIFYELRQQLHISLRFIANFVASLYNSCFVVRETYIDG